MSFVRCVSLSSFVLSFGAMAQTRHLSPDFFVFETDALSARLLSQRNSTTPPSLAECRAAIRPKMCLVEQPLEDIDGAIKPRPCKTGGEAYAPQLEAIFDAYPAALQRVFCSLNVIYIEEQFFGTAYAGAAVDENGNPAGAIMGIRKSVLDERLDLSRWASWKEQLAFGADTKGYELLEGKPTITASLIDPRINDFLYFVIAHEFGHILDFANRANRVECKNLSDPNNPKDCTATGPWTKLSWQGVTQPLPKKNYAFRDDFCFYWCNGNFPGLAHVAQMYEGLWESTFISSYASKNAWDDLAETMAYVVADDEQALNYMLSTGEGVSYDSVHKLNSERMREKRTWMREFLSRPDLVYP